MFRVAMLAGVLASVPALAFAQQASGGYSCPTAGSSLERTRGDDITYRAGAPAPFVCATTTGTQRLLGYWSTGEAFYRNGRPELERMLNTAFTTRQPAQATFTYFSHSAIGYIPNRVQESWSVPGVERVSTPAGDFEAMRVERVFHVMDTLYRYRQTLWVDTRTGTPVRSEVEHTNGIMAAHVFSWRAAQIEARQMVSAR